MSRGAHAEAPRSRGGSRYTRIAQLLTCWGRLCGNILDSERRSYDVSVSCKFMERSID